MTDKLTGQQLLQQAQDSISEAHHATLVKLFTTVLLEVQKREVFIAARNVQIVKLQSLQKRAISIYDNGQFDEHAMKELGVELRQILNEGVAEFSKAKGENYGA